MKVTPHKYTKYNNLTLGQASRLNNWRILIMKGAIGNLRNLLFTLTMSQKSGNDEMNNLLDRVEEELIGRIEYVKHDITATKFFRGFREYEE